MIIAIANNKGGVAKTTTSGNLASKLWPRSRNVLLVDLDPQGNLAEFLGLRPQLYPSPTTTQTAPVSPSSSPAGPPCAIRSSRPIGRMTVCHRPNLYLLPASRQLEYTTEELLVQDFVNRRSQRNHVPIEDLLNHHLGPAQKVFDTIIIDCPPKLDTLKLAVYRFAQKVIVPVKTDYISVAGAVQHTKELATLRSAGDVTCRARLYRPHHVRPASNPLHPNAVTLSPPPTAAVGSPCRSPTLLKSKNPPPPVAAPSSNTPPTPRPLTPTSISFKRYKNYDLSSTLSTARSTLAGYSFSFFTLSA